MVTTKRPHETEVVGVAPSKRSKGNALETSVETSVVEEGAGEATGDATVEEQIEESGRVVRALTAKIPTLLQSIVDARSAAASEHGGDDNASGPLASERLTRAVRSLALVAMSLKTAARNVAFLTDAQHMRLVKSKDALNRHDLDLQSLLYEQRHLTEQIIHCKDFRSKHEDINLVPVETFQREAPPELADATDDNSHKLFLNRLSYETMERQRLSELLKTAEAKNLTVNNKIVEDEKYLQSVRSKLEAILDHTKPLQKSLTLSRAQGNTSNELAKYLSPPLYALYFSAIGYCDGVDKECSVEIVGDIDVAKAFFCVAQ